MARPRDSEIELRGGFPFTPAGVQAALAANSDKFTMIADRLNRDALSVLDELFGDCLPAEAREATQSQTLATMGGGLQTSTGTALTGALTATVSYYNNTNAVSLC